MLLYNSSFPYILAVFVLNVQSMCAYTLLLHLWPNLLIWTKGGLISAKFLFDSTVRSIGILPICGFSLVSDSFNLWL